MKNEIKEILNKYKMYMSFDGNEYEMILKAELYKLLDYITNLQEENEKQHKGFLAVCKEAKDLQQRIDKAVEYINKFESIRAYYEYEDCGYTEYNYDEDFKQDLLEILRGED